MKKLAAVSMTALMIALLVGLVATPASAQQYPPKKPTCQVSDTTISPGDQVTVSGEGWKPGSTVHFTLKPEGIDLGSATVAGDGSFSVDVSALKAPFAVKAAALVEGTTSSPSCPR